MKLYTVMNLKRSGAKNEPLYTMQEIGEKIGLTRHQIVALGRAHGNLQQEFDASYSRGTVSKPKFKLSVAKKWLASIPQDAREKALSKSSPRGG